MTAYINGIGTAVPEHDIHQSVNAVLRTMLPDQRARRVFDRMAEQSGIGHRYSFMRVGGHADEQVVDADGFYRRGNFPGTSARMALYQTEALRLAMRAVAALTPDTSTGLLDGVTHLVVASCTGFTAPGLDLQLVTALGLQPDVQRTLVSFMGCSAAVPALRVAYQAVHTDPAARVLVVNLELCSLHLQETSDLNALLPLTLFADGASAALVTAQPAGIALLDFLAIIIPDSSDLMTWRIGDKGFNMHLSGQVPQRIKQTLRDEMEQGAANKILRGKQVKDFDVWAVHPGGRSVLDAVETGLGLTSSDLSRSRQILHNFGNMSSATIMFVLQDILRLHQNGDNHHHEARGLAMAFGPGMVAETFRFQMAA